MLEPFIFGCAVEEGQGVVDFLGVKIGGIARSVRVSDEDSQSVPRGDRVLYRMQSMTIYISVRSHDFLIAGSHQKLMNKSFAAASRRAKARICAELWPREKPQWSHIHYGESYIL